MDTGQARPAYADLTLARDFEPRYPRLEARLREAYAQSIHRIAILPFANQTEVHGLSVELTDRIYQEVAQRIREKDFPFTVLVSRQEVYGRVTLTQAENLAPREAVDLGRALEADYIVRGRVYGLRAESNSDAFRQTIYRRVEEPDTSGRTVERYAEVPLDVAARLRRVTVRFEFEIRDTNDGSIVAVHDDTVTSEARVVFTAFHAEGDSRNYCLVPPPMRKADSAAAARPVFLAELPPANDLAAIALRDSWQPVLRAVKEVER